MGATAAIGTDAKALRRFKPSRDFSPEAWRVLAERMIERVVADYRDGLVDLGRAIRLIRRCTDGCQAADREKLNDAALRKLDMDAPRKTRERKPVFTRRQRLAVGDLVAWLARSGLPVDRDSLSGNDAISVAIEWLIDLEFCHRDNAPAPSTVHGWYLDHQRVDGITLRPGRRRRDR